MFIQFTFFGLIYIFCFLPISILMHLCIMLCTYWTPLLAPLMEPCEVCINIECLKLNSKFFVYLSFLYCLIRFSSYCLLLEKLLPIASLPNLLVSHNGVYES